MTKFKLVGAALVLAAILQTPVSAQVSEPSAALAQNPSFSVYSNYSGGAAGFAASRAMAQTLPEDALGPRVSMRRHRAHYAIKH